MNTNEIISQLITQGDDTTLWDSAQQKEVLGNNITWENISSEQAIGFNGTNSHLDFSKNPLFYNPSFVMWVDVVPGNKTGMQHVYGHIGRDSEDFWCNAQLTWDASNGTLSFRVGAEGVYEIVQAGFAPQQRYFIIGRCINQNVDLWINGQQVGSLSMPKPMRSASIFGLWAGQRDYVKYGERLPFLGQLFECGLAHDTSDEFINQLIEGDTVPEPEPEPDPDPEPNPEPQPVPTPLPQQPINYSWQYAELNALNKMFSFGKNGIYEDLSGHAISCRVFLDTGWRDELSGYDSHAVEQVTQVSVFLSEIPHPRQNDQITIDNKQYQVISIDAEDEYMAVLNVKSA